MSITKNATLTLLIASIADLAAPARAQCVGDIIPDGQVDGIDLGVLLGYWGPRTSATFSIASDLNHDGFVDGSDLGTLLGNWGPCVVPPFNVPAWATLIEGPPNPSVVTDAVTRQRIMGTGWAWRVLDTATQIEMLLVPPGTFQMGCSPSVWEGCQVDEMPTHSVTLTGAFYLGRFEVTQSQWAAQMGSNPSNFQNASAQVPVTQVPSRPVEGVSWDAVQAFLELTDMRLPTEAEWEFACRAGTTSAFNSGSDDAGSLLGLAWCNLNAVGQTRPVGLLGANRFGLHDMHGNVYEWVSDRYSSSYYESSPLIDPPGPSEGQMRIGRGGSYPTVPSSATSHSRAHGVANQGFLNVGFRVARNP